MAKLKKRIPQLGFLGFLAAFVVLVTSLFILQHQTNMFAKAGDRSTGATNQGRILEGW